MRVAHLKYRGLHVGLERVKAAVAPSNGAADYTPVLKGLKQQMSAAHVNSAAAGCPPDLEGRS